MIVQELVAANDDRYRHVERESGQPKRGMWGQAVNIDPGDQSVRHWIMAHHRAFEYFGGVPGRWIIDNRKAGVGKADREEPRLNPSFGKMPVRIQP